MLKMILFHSVFWSWLTVLICHLSTYISKPIVSSVSIFGRTFRFSHPALKNAFTALAQKTWHPTGNDSSEMLVLCAIYAVVLLFLLTVVAYIPRLFANKKSKIYGSATWATKKELKKASLLGPYGVIMGQTDDAKYKQVRNKTSKHMTKAEKDASNSKNPDGRVKFKYQLKRPGTIISHHETQHVLGIGGTRSGKGIGLVIPTCFSWNGSMICMDPKGEAWAITAPFRSTFSRTMKLEPEHPKTSAHYNPLAAIRRGTNALSDIQSLAAIFIPETSGDNKIWSDEGRKLFSCVIGYVIYCMPPEKKNFESVYSFFSSSEVSAENGDASTKDYLNQYVANIDDFISNKGLRGDEAEAYRNRFDLPEEERKKLEERMVGYLTDEDIKTLIIIQNDMKYFAQREDKYLSSVVGTMASTLLIFQNPNVLEITRYSDFTFEDMMQGDVPISLYLIASSDGLKTLAPLFKVIYEQCVSILTRELRPYKHLLLLLFDEFRQLGKMEIVEKALSLSAGYGVICMIIIQSYAQLTSLYQEKAMLTDNFQYQVVLSANDPNTAKDIAGMIGSKTVKKTSVSYSGQSGNTIHAGENISVHEQGRSLMNADEIRTMPFEDVLIIATGINPIKAKKIMWFADPRFTKLHRKYKEYPKIEDNRLNTSDKEHWMSISYGNSLFTTQEQVEKDMEGENDGLYQIHGDEELISMADLPDNEVDAAISLIETLNVFNFGLDMEAYTEGDKIA